MKTEKKKGEEKMSYAFRSTGKVDAYNIKDLILVPKAGTLKGMENKVLVLNNVAAFIWSRLDDGRSISVIEEELSKVYEVEKSVEVQDDLNYFIETLVYLGFIQPRDVGDKQVLKPAPPEEGTTGEPEPYRHPKIYVYDLETEQETAFGPHIRGKSLVHNSILRSWHGGCC